MKLRPDANKGGFLGRAALCLVRAAISAIDECGWPDDHGPDGLRSRRPTGPSFRECRELADQLELGECSMGMSGDWHEAAAAGSTWLRLGSVLFGPRPTASPAAG